mgnify:CR=1 FL=1
MTQSLSRSETAELLSRLSAELPPKSAFLPVSAALERAAELKEAGIEGALRSYLSMPQSTMIIANPPLHHTQVDCAGTAVDLKVRSFAIRACVTEGQIVSGEVDPYTLFFAGLFGRLPKGEEKGLWSQAIEGAFFRALGFEEKPREKRTGDAGLLPEIGEFVRTHPGLGSDVTVQFFLMKGKADRWATEGQGHGISNRRPPMELLADMIDVQMEAVAVGGCTAYMNHLLRQNPRLSASDLVQRTRAFLESETGRGSGALGISYGLLLGRPANEAETVILQRMGAIQTHHGSAGSNMVARYLTTLHAASVRDVFLAASLTMEGYRHFGAIHDMTHFVRDIEKLSSGERDRAIREKVLTGGLPTFGHPEISAAGRSGQIEQDPRPAIYLTPLFRALDAGEIALDDRQRHRLGIVERIYQIAFVEGVVKPGREGQEPLRLTPNTDYGAWAVQEALGIADTDRTYLTIIFRGFGWMMDVREQLQQPIVRPVIAPDPAIVPKPGDDHLIPDVVRGCHDRLARGKAFSRR